MLSGPCSKAEGRTTSRSGSTALARSQNEKKALEAIEKIHITSSGGTRRLCAAPITSSLSSNLLVFKSPNSITYT